MDNNNITEQLNTLLDTQVVEQEPIPLPEPKLPEFIDYDSFVSRNRELPKLKFVPDSVNTSNSDENTAIGKTRNINLAGKVRFCRK